MAKAEPEPRHDGGEAAQRVGGAGPGASAVPEPSRSEGAAAEAEFGEAKPACLQQEAPGPEAGRSRPSRPRAKPHDLKNLSKALYHVHGGGAIPTRHLGRSGPEPSERRWRKRSRRGFPPGRASRRPPSRWVLSVEQIRHRGPGPCGA